MKINTWSGAILAGIINGATALGVLFADNQELEFSDISTAAWVTLGTGVVVQLAKDFQALSTRRLVNKLTGTGDGGI